MNDQYEQSSAIERQLWREKLRHRLMYGTSEYGSDQNIIEKSVKFIRYDCSYFVFFLIISNHDSNPSNIRPGSSIEILFIIVA
jgi:hypothetical protein